MVFVFAEVGHVENGLVAAFRGRKRFVRGPIDGVPNGGAGGLSVGPEERDEGGEEHLTGGDLAERFTQTIRATAFVAGKGRGGIGVEELQKRRGEGACVGEVHGFVGAGGKDEVRLDFPERGLKLEADLLCEVKRGKGAKQARPAGALQEKLVQKAKCGARFGNRDAMERDRRIKGDRKRLPLGLAGEEVDAIAPLRERIGQCGSNPVRATTGTEDILIKGKDRVGRVHRPEISESPCSRIKVAARSAALRRASRRVAPCPSCVRSRVR